MHLPQHLLTSIMKDQSEYIHHIESVLSGKERAETEDLPLIRRLADLSATPDFDVRVGYERLQAAVDHRERQRRQRRRLVAVSLGAVAAFIGMLMILLLPQRGGELVPEESQVAMELLRQSYILPDSLAGDRDLVLLRADGSRVHLRIGDQDTLKMAEMAYLLRPDEAVTLIVPETRRGNVLLEDGTVVLLNSVSRLRMPTSLTDGRRIALESGEALMDVAHNEKHPFRVALPEMDLEVLGTTFNICLYPEQEPTTTLVEGRLRVSDKAGRSLMLHPGEEAVRGRDGSLESRPADLRTKTAWVEGTFVFSHLSLSSIMTYLGRWYGFDTTFTSDALKENTYTGALKREYSRDFAFSLLETTTNLSITNQQHEERHVVVSHR